MYLEYYSIYMKYGYYIYDIVDMYFSNTFFGRSEKNFFSLLILRFLLLEITKTTWLADATIYLYGYMLVETYPNF